MTVSTRSSPGPPSPGLLEAVPGFLDPPEGRVLFDLARRASRWGPCLEIGSYCGRSTLFLGAGCRLNRAVLFSVDHHRGSEEHQPGQAYHDPQLVDPATGRVDTFPAFRRTLDAAGLADTVVPLVCASTLAARAWTIPLSLVFIDGGHALDTVRADYLAWVSHVLPRGYLVFHDVFEDPRDGGQAPHRILQAALASGLFRRLPGAGSLGVLQRLAPGAGP